jgi:hypothetical protein
MKKLKILNNHKNNNKKVSSNNTNQWIEDKKDKSSVLTSIFRTITT